MNIILSLLFAKTIFCRLMLIYFIIKIAHAVTKFSQLMKWINAFLPDKLNLPFTVCMLMNGWLTKSNKRLTNIDSYHLLIFWSSLTKRIAIKISNLYYCKVLLYYLLFKTIHSLLIHFNFNRLWSIYLDLICIGRHSHYLIAITCLLLY